MQRIESSKLCAIQQLGEVIAKLDSGPHVDMFTQESKHHIFLTLKQMQFGLDVTDIHDPFSVHFAAHENGLVCGGARLVLPNDPLGIPSFKLLSRHLAIEDIQASQYGEITHFVAHEQARRRHTDMLDGASKSIRPLEVRPHIHLSKNQIFILRILKSIFVYAKQMNIEYIVSLMTQAMQQTLRNFHFAFQRIDSETSEINQQSPASLCVFQIAELEKNLIQTGQEVGKWFVRSEVIKKLSYSMATSFG